MNEAGPALLRGRIGFRHQREVREIEWPVCTVDGDEPETIYLHGECLSRTSTELRGGGVLAPGIRWPRWAS
jgi:hypothetical protein